MDPITIPAAVLTFLLALGCNPTTEVYEVDRIEVPFAKREPLGLYCHVVEEPYCPKANVVMLKKGMNDTSVLVHELYHSCQQKAAYGTYEHIMNEKQAEAVQNYWRGR